MRLRCLRCSELRTLTHLRQWYGNLCVCVGGGMRITFLWLTTSSNKKILSTKAWIRWLTNISIWVFNYVGISPNLLMYVTLFFGAHVVRLHGRLRAGYCFATALLDHCPHTVSTVHVSTAPAMLGAAIVAGCLGNPTYFWNNTALGNIRNTNAQH